MDISIIIVEYMDYEIVRKAIQSIYDNVSDARFQIIVISNSLYPPEKQIEIRSISSNVQFIFNAENVGFSKAVNQGIRESSGEFVILMNPDTELIDNGLSGAVSFMRNNTKIACLGPMIIDCEGKIQDSCREFMTIGRLLKRTIVRLFGLASGGVLEDKDYSLPQNVDWLSGAYILARKAAIDDAGLMDERYFMYVEDMDWCRNFKMHGWGIYYWPEWKVVHDAGRGSSGGFQLMNRLLWIHISSLLKYYVKWSFSKDANVDIAGEEEIDNKVVS